MDQGYQYSIVRNRLSRNRGIRSDLQISLLFGNFFVLSSSSECSSKNSEEIH